MCPNRKKDGRRDTGWIFVNRSIPIQAINLTRSRSEILLFDNKYFDGYF